MNCTTPVKPPRIAQSPTCTWPESWALFASTVLLPIWQSWATWTYAMIQLSSPMCVTRASFVVPRLNVQYSRIALRSPISRRVGSPAYFLSCGGPPRTLKLPMRLSRPMRVGPSMIVCGPIVVPSPISTCSPTIE
jgi:hypothetical protein